MLNVSMKVRLKTVRRPVMEKLNYWKSTLEDVEESISSLRKGKVRILGESAGGRNIYLVEYGERDQYQRTANYISACGAGILKAYKDNKHPHIVLIGGVHGAEWEGIVSIINLMQVLETGRDLRGKEYPELAEWMKHSYLAIIPVMNPDGRARIPKRTVVGMTREEYRHLGQGTWKDGSYCNWPQCKEFQPIKEHVSSMGGYYNEDGYNLMHDSFFSPKTNEVKLLMEYLEDVAPDIVINLHGHAGTENSYLLPAMRHPRPYFNALLEFEESIIERMKQEGYSFIKNVEKRYHPNKTFMNLDDAIHLHCGAFALCFESDQGIIARPGDENKMENRHQLIYECHMVFFEELAKFALKDIVTDTINSVTIND